MMTNGWRINQRCAQAPSSSPDRGGKSGWVLRRLRRYLLVYPMLLGACWISWKWYLRPRWEEHTLLSESLEERMRIGKEWVGSNVRPSFNDMVHMKTLDRRLVPGSGSGPTGKRLIVVGDVHGCKDECVTSHLFPNRIYGIRGTLT